MHPSWLTFSRPPLCYKFNAVLLLIFVFVMGFIMFFLYFLVWVKDFPSYIFNVVFYGSQDKMIQKFIFIKKTWENIFIYILLAHVHELLDQHLIEHNWLQWINTTVFYFLNHIAYEIIPMNSNMYKVVITTKCIMKVLSLIL